MTTLAPFLKEHQKHRCGLGFPVPRDEACSMCWSAEECPKSSLTAGAHLMRHIIHVNPPPTRDSKENYEFATHAGSGLPKMDETTRCATDKPKDRQNGKRG